MSLCQGTDTVHPLCGCKPQSLTPDQAQLGHDLSQVWRATSQAGLNPQNLEVLMIEKCGGGGCLARVQPAEAPRGKRWQDENEMQLQR